MLEAILSKYLLNALLLSLVSIAYSFLKNKLGEDRASTIKEAILSAMLWAEEELGIGNGNQKCSFPLSSRNFPLSSKISVGKGPPPTRVV